jgi:ssDNA-binding Zn-finger/Zn-ribbon topoisomerase 1
MVRERMHEMGPGGDCVCPKCGERISHQKGERCQERKCPKCGAKMLREGSEHHRKL